MGRPNVNWNVGIAADKHSTYTSKAVKAGIPFASQVIEPNTKYIIKYDFDLGGETVTIPDNCVLKFDGGSLKNGTLVGSNTTLVYLRKEDVLQNVELVGTFFHVVGLPATNSLVELFEKENMLNNPLFGSSDDWNMTDCEINGNKLLINGKGFASQTKQLLSKHRYLAICYARITDVHHGAKGASTSFYGRYGIGFQVKDLTPYNGEYKLNVDFIGNREKSDFVPVFYVFDVYNDCNPTISFGEIYDGNGTIEGEIAHAGLYDITNIVKGIPNYKDLYYAYKTFVENRIQYRSSNQNLKYPDSMCDLAFIEEMNEKAHFSYMNHSRFFNPSGAILYQDMRNDTVSYITEISSTEIMANKVVYTSGNIGNVSGYKVYVYDIPSDNLRYFFKDSYASAGAGVARVAFRDSEKGVLTTLEEYNHRSYREDFYGIHAVGYGNVGYLEEIYVPQKTASLYITSEGNTYIPKLYCISEVPINYSSQRIDINSDYLEFRYKSTLVSAKDVCIFNGLAATNRKLQEVWNRQKSDLTMFYDGEVSFTHGTNVQMARTNSAFNNSFFRIYGKGGSWKSKTIEYRVVTENNDGELRETTAWKDFGFGNCVKDRNTGKWYSVALLRYHYLPRYNYITELPSDAELATALQTNRPSIYTEIAGLQPGEYYIADNNLLQTYYPEIWALKALNEDSGSLTEALIKWYQETDGCDDIVANIDYDVYAVCEIYPDMPFVYNEIETYNAEGYTSLEKKLSIVRGKNINQAVHPMSITKTMTLLVALDYLNLSDYIEYKEGNITAGSGWTFNNGEYYTVRDMIIFLLASSDNSIATNICNQVGQKILEAKYGK